MPNFVAPCSSALNLLGEPGRNEIMGLFIKSTSWAIYDCRLGTIRIIEEVPFLIGTGDGVDFAISGDDELHEEHFLFDETKEGDASIRAVHHDAKTLVNGVPVQQHPVTPYREYLIQAGKSFLVLNGCSNAKRWGNKLRANSWEIIDGNGARMQPMAIEDIVPMLSTNPDAANWRVTLEGMVTPDAFLPVTHLLPRAAAGALPPVQGAVGGETIGRVEHDKSYKLVAGAWQEELVAEYEEQVPGQEEQITGQEEQVEPHILPDRGKHRCPYCMLRFEEEDILWAASHEELRSDPVLGPGHFLRFLPNPGNYDAEIRVRDSKGSICTEQACPHCRTGLPFGFIEIENHTFSIIGDASAGKSYYLAVLVKQLEKTLQDSLNITFSDLEPQINVHLEEMKNTLFGHGTAAASQILKTDPEGLMYVEIIRDGRKIKVPRPFIFKVNSGHHQDGNHGITFYDHAGEDFQPGRSTREHPRTRHVSCASGITFLFDPFNSIEFRQRMTKVDCQDPQMKHKEGTDRHHSMLDEIGVTIRGLRHMPPNEKINEPLAFIVGKYDAWRNCFPACHFDNPMEKQACEDVYFTEGTCTIGRKTEAHSVDVDLPLATISRQHADLSLQKDRIEITDLGSKFGTYIDGIQLKPHEPTVIKPFSKARLGKYIMKLDYHPDSGGDFSFTLKLLETLKTPDLDIITSNSAKLRGILEETCPGLVSRAEQISHNVLYFPVSTFGHTPVEISSGSKDAGNELLPVAPDPSQLKPYLVEIPTLWILSHALPGLIPTEAIYVGKT